MTDEERFLSTLAESMGDVLKENCNMPMGFMVLISPLHQKDHVSNYVGNINRESAIEWLRTTADRLESEQTIGQTVGGMH